MSRVCLFDWRFGFMVRRSTTFCFQSAASNITVLLDHQRTTRRCADYCGFVGMQATNVPDSFRFDRFSAAVERPVPAERQLIVVCVFRFGDRASGFAELI
jgi:hypothetical protein